MRFPHTVVWIDHFSAEVVQFGPDAYEADHLESGGPDRHLHRKSGIPGSGHQGDDTDLFERVADELASKATAVLVVGPGTAKQAFERHLHRARPDVASKLVGVDAVDHLSSGQLIDHARRRFVAIDRLRGVPDH